VPTFLDASYAVPNFSLHRARIPMGCYLCIKYKINKKNNKRIIKKTGERIIRSLGLELWTVTLVNHP